MTELAPIGVDVLPPPADDLSDAVSLMPLLPVTTERTPIRARLNGPHSQISRRHGHDFSPRRRQSLEKPGGAQRT